MNTALPLSTICNYPRTARGVKKVAIVGALDGTHVGASLTRAAAQLKLDTIVFDVADAFSGNRYLRALYWRFAGRRPVHLRRFSAQVIATCATARPEILIATGAAPLTEHALRALHALGVVCINYSTDDPWNPTQLAHWYLRALPAYNAVFTTRRSNLDEIRRLGCADVHYLPFAYDDVLFAPPDSPMDAPAYDVLFVGGADRDRVAFILAFMKSGPPVALVGGYWNRFSATRQHALGQKPPETVRDWTAAKVNLCLVRRANRDGHVMRSFEIAAVGGCMLAEDTAEHREIFGPDGEAVLYFRTPEEAGARARVLIANPTERARLSASIRARIVAGHHTYRDRLASMLDATAELRREGKFGAKGIWK